MVFDFLACLLIRSRKTVRRPFLKNVSVLQLDTNADDIRSGKRKYTKRAGYPGNPQKGINLRH